VDKGDFGPEHLMPVGLDGQPVPPEARRPSAETLLHTLVYRLRPDVKAVLHVHAPLSVVVSRARLAEGAVRFSGWELQKGLRGVGTHEAEVEIPIFGNQQDMPALAREIEPALTARPDLRAFLLAGHGLYAFGASVAEAKRHVEVVETLLEHERLWRMMS
jgi:methylthioribulose-1-phosphate dehydratase